MLVEPASTVDTVVFGIVGTVEAGLVKAQADARAQNARQHLSLDYRLKTTDSSDGRGKPVFERHWILDPSLCAIGAARSETGEARLTMIEAIGIGREREMDGDPPSTTLESLLDLSEALLDKAQGSPLGLASDDMLAAAESLERVSRKMRELAGTRCPGGAEPDRAVSGCEPNGARILLADDLDLNRKLIADMLSLDGHEVDCVTDGASAVRAVEARRYDLVLMDMVMPGMDGLAATRAIRALHGPARDVPIVALTANAFREQLNSCLEAGMNAAVAKPLTIDALTSVVLQWTRDRHAAA